MTLGREADPGFPLENPFRRPVMNSGPFLVCVKTIASTTGPGRVAPLLGTMYSCKPQLSRLYSQLRYGVTASSLGLPSSLQPELEASAWVVVAGDDVGLDTVISSWELSHFSISFIAMKLI